MTHSDVRVIAVTGGIGSGKSVVTRILAALGYPVYDCDSRARLLMDDSDDIRRRLVDDISPDVVDAEGNIDRKLLGSIVFSDKMALARLNAIVHRAVIADLGNWIGKHSLASHFLFVETAILYESGVDSLVDEVWEVSAPVEVRIDRVMRRNALSRDEVLSRISSQRANVDPRHHMIVNDGMTAVIPQIHALLGSR